MRNFSLFLAFTISCLVAKSQTMDFVAQINRFFFAENLKLDTSIIDTFYKIPQLHHSHKVAKQSSLNVSLQLNTDQESWSYKHLYTFLESPIKNLKMEKGVIEVLIGEAPGIKKLLDINWKIEFANKKDAEKYWENIKLIFEKLSTNSEYSKDKDIGKTARFYKATKSDGLISEINFFLNKSFHSQKYEISFIWGIQIGSE